MKDTQQGAPERSEPAQRVAPQPQSAVPAWQSALLRLQRSVGNQNTLRLLASSKPPGTLRRKCACEDEQTPCAECAKKKLQRAEASPGISGAGEAPPIVHNVLRSAGNTLDGETRNFMESRFGHDFSAVRIHTDSRAAESARAVNALAYTVGNNVVFGAGQYGPRREGGQRLLAHELAHVVQQSAGGTALQSKVAVGSTDDAAEHEADAAAAAVMQGMAGSGPLMRLTPGAPVLRRVYTTPQGIREARPATESLPDGGSRTITRRIAICPCRRVDETRDAFYYNPDIDELALAYRRCTGSRTWTFFGRYDSNASQSLQIPELPQGTGRAGGSLSMRGDRTSGRVDLYGLGANDQPGGAAGGGATVTIETRGWAFTASGEYRRLLDPAPGTARDQAQMSGRICPPGWPFCIGAQGTIGDPRLGNSVQGTISSRDDVPTIHQTCSQCVCPRRLTYDCQEDHPHRDPRTRELRYYYALDRSDRPTEEPYLQSANQRNFEEIAALIRRGYRITSIEGYASPEAAVQHNQPLSEHRAGATAQLLRTYLDSQGLQSAVIPAETPGRGELLGSRPRPVRSSQLDEIVTDAGIMPAELETLLLSGAEIRNPDLERQFRGLFSDRRMTPDLRMELFGLDANDPARPEVQAAVDDFLAHRAGTRARPWERIFRLFRYGAIFLEGSEVTGTDHSTLSESDCNRFARAAEHRNDFGPVDHAAIQSETRSMDNTAECDTESGTAHGDCHYVAAPSTLSPETPEGTPRQIP
ncbi:MAG: DUF4157 domain-containing protein [Acidobacteriia bacterium]|nr:DUF4157 domain-containing protein [Terriglobia bacterium]